MVGGLPEFRSLRFNPTLVRLRLPRLPSCSAFPRGFNPTLVRLRQQNSVLEIRNRLLFQSHAGSIEAWSAASVFERGHWFQSHAGSIEAALLHRRRPNRQSFQSHAGSIEALRGGPGRGGPCRFQSHAGSIEATSMAMPASLCVMVSIPRWFD